MADAREEMFPQLGDEWDLAKDSLKFSNRYFNNDIREFLDTIFGGIKIFMDYSRHRIITEIDQNSPSFKVFRARCFDSKEDSQKAIKNNELGPPPPEMSKAGRLNVAGIPVFYGATSPRLALAETRPSVGSYVVVVQFEVLRQFKLLDIEGLGSIFHSATEYFDLDDEIMQLAVFLNEFSSEITKTVSPKEESLEYIVTQAISEYLSEVSNMDIHGIIYDSSQATKKDKDGNRDERNIMLFGKFSNIYGTSNDFPSILHMSKSPPITHVVTGADFSTYECNNVDSKAEF